MLESDVDLVHLQKQLATLFNLEEIQQLCAELHIEYEELVGAARSAKARELVKFCYRRGRIGELVALCQAERPGAEWDQSAMIYRHDELPDEWAEPLQRLYRLVKEFNRNRQQSFSEARTREGDDITFTMREVAPFLFGTFDVAAWLSSSSVGKRLAAIKYLDWLQDVEYLEELLGKLVTERPFVQFHVLVAIDRMLDQLDEKRQKVVQLALTAHRFPYRDPSLDYWRDRILGRLRAL